MNCSEIQCRPIVLPDDLTFLSKVYASTRLEELAVTNWPQEQIDQFLMMQFNAQHQYYLQEYAGATYEILLKGNKEIGRLYTEIREDEIRIIDITLLTPYRNMGIGRVLIKEILTKATNLRKCVRIHVEKNNPALNLYVRLGFHEIEDKEVYSLMEYKSCNTVSV